MFEAMSWREMAERIDARDEEQSLLRKSAALLHLPLILLDGGEG